MKGRDSYVRKERIIPSQLYINKTIILNENKSCLDLLSRLAYIHERKWNKEKSPDNQG